MEEDLKAEQDAIEDGAQRRCWKKYAEKAGLAIWQKPFNHIECENNRKKDSELRPHICSKSENPDTTWYRKMETCISPLPDTKDQGQVAGGALAKWPAHLVALPPRIVRNSLAGIIAETFNTGLKLWEESVKYYENSLIPPLAKGRYRNIMDMSSGLGSFAAALANDSIWVMNTIAPDANELSVIYEHGLIGTYQN
ncbi:unnamed protein product [Sphagnum troendelagicum]|uniref:Methyltransferase n=1 Tax=Sphagnum troendelagicum TaxID=128251 RepID=A0ABP0TEU3_9BRYO